MDSQGMMARAEYIGDDDDRPTPRAATAGDQRKAPRHATTSQIGLMHVGASEDFCRIRNVSQTGFMAHVYRAMAVGDEVRVETKCGQSLHGSVVWASEHVPDLASRAVRQIGVRFADPIDVEPILTSRFTTQDGALQRWPRLSIACHLRLILDGGRQYSGSLCDISQGGAKLQTSHALSGEARGLLVIRGLPGLHARICWISGTRIGVSFDRTIPLEDLVQWIQDRRAEAPAGRPALTSAH